MRSSIKQRQWGSPSGTCTPTMRGNNRAKSHIWDAVQKEKYSIILVPSLLCSHALYLTALSFDHYSADLCLLDGVHLLIHCIRIKRLLYECWDTEHWSTLRCSRNIAVKVLNDEARLLPAVHALCHEGDTCTDQISEHHWGHWVHSLHTPLKNHLLKNQQVHSGVCAAWDDRDAPLHILAKLTHKTMLILLLLILVVL